MDMYVCQTPVEKRLVSQLQARGSSRVEEKARLTVRVHATLLISLFLTTYLLLSRSQAFGSERLYNVSMSHASDATIALKHP